ncbi:sulfite exporter TauE/SafE family protein [Archaeoglobus neptunius]|uniref:sulfite exporter TauE/SafE family protein n=1 Tax=Archaeoglobus neptunius TaxID=2798580 RepID=UPI001927A26C|nr:sulfite exporter TauE/SafE family protein [Archaeoglobus neptunius]
MKIQITKLVKYWRFILVALLLTGGIEVALASPQGNGGGALQFFLEVYFACVAMGTTAIIAGTGGGVLFTTLFLGFTNIHPDVIRATGLLAAMSGTRMGARRFLKKGIANVRLVLVVGVTYTVFAIIGAIVGLKITRELGEYGIALIKLLLGLIVVAVGVVYLITKKTDYPEPKKIDSFTRKLGVEYPYWEDSLGSVVDYRVTRAPLAILAFCAVGFVSGMFGLGAGWAVTPVLNLVMLAPLKVATTTSAVIISLGDTAAIFPYLMANAIVPIFAVPAVAGLITGAEIGSRIAVRVRPSVVRYILIGILFFTGSKLVLTGLTLMGVI